MESNGGNIAAQRNLGAEKHHILYIYTASEKSRILTTYPMKKFILVQETEMSLQYWFERITGVTDEERRRMARAKTIFGQRGFDTTALQTPACWRRSSATPHGRRELSRR